MDKQLSIMLIGFSLLFIINIVLVVLVLKSNKSSSYSELLKNAEKQNETIRKELRDSRMELAQSQSSQRREISQSLGAMNEKIERSAKATYEFSLKATDTISKGLEKIQASNGESLEKMRLTVDEKLSQTLESRLNSSFSTVGKQLESVYKSLGEMKVLSGNVTQNVSSLNRILTNVKARGTWAEVALDGILSQTVPGMFERNFMPDEKSKIIVEFAVKIPSGDDSGSVTYLPIDSKFPIEDYIRLCDAADNADIDGVKAARKALESRVLAQAKEVSKYIKEPQTTPFAIMYLATEGLYGEIIGSKNAVAERCQSQYNVMIAGPSTITALLNSLSVGFRAIAVNEKAKEVRKLLAAAKSQYDKFGLLLEKAKKKIDEAGKSLDDAQTRNTLIQKKLKNVEQIDYESAERILEEDE